MGETIWRTREVGALGVPTTDILDPDEAGGLALLIHDGVPDHVRVPDNSPIYAGESRRVAGVSSRPCPAGCGCDHLCLDLAGPGRLLVVQCSTGFLVCQRREA